MNSAAQAHADLMLKQMKTSPAIVGALFDHAITFFAKKHTVLESAIEAAYVAGAPAVVAQVNKLMIVGWFAVHAKAHTKA